MDEERKTMLRDSKDKYPLLYSSRSAYGGDHHYYSTGFLGGFSWPPRSYTCSFCRREFKSAQALGGHMNVHRRERALLRQSPPWEAHPSSQNPNLNSLPFSDNNFATTSCSASLLASSHTWASTSSPPMPSASTLVRDHGVDLTKSLFVDGDMEASEANEVGNHEKNGSLVTLDLEICLLKRDAVDHSDHVSVHDQNDQDLDLELRLGYN